MRLDGIDVLRVTTVIFVQIYHFFVLLRLNSIHSFGIFGVSLFVIISGYLIYRLIHYSISIHGIKSGLKKYTLHSYYNHATSTAPAIYGQNCSAYPLLTCSEMHDTPNPLLKMKLNCMSDYFHNENSRTIYLSHAHIKENTFEIQTA